MKRNLLIAVALVGITGWASMAVAADGGWFERLDELDAALVEADTERAGLAVEIEEFDDVLQREVTDPEMARRATEQLRSDVAGQLARWDKARRHAERIGATGDTAEAKLLQRVIGEFPPAADESWRRNVGLLAEIDQGVEYSAALLVRRGRLQVEYAQVAAESDKTEAERQQLTQQADREASDEELKAEIEQAVGEIERKLDFLNPLVSHDDFYREKGTLLPPVNASPDHRFGPRQRAGSFTEVRHSGLTWMLEVGTEVRCVADGIVAEIDRVPGFGNIVIVDHGDDHHSLYAHLDESVVEQGDSVEAGDIVGLSGETGSLEGPKLYFELRRRGRPVDPEEWFVRR